MSPPIRRLWWLNPAWLFAVVIGITILAAAWQSDAAYLMYGTPKYIAGVHVVLAFAAIIAFGIGARLDALTGREPTSTPPEFDRVVRFWFWLAFALTLFGYAVWGGVGVKNGFTPGMLIGLIVDADTYAAEETVRTELFPTIPGVTTCTHFKLVVVMLGMWLFVRGDRRVVWPMVLVFGLAVIQAMLWRERTAIIAMILPGAIVWLRSYVLNRPQAPLVRAGLQFGPVIAFMTLLLCFGASEYFRSWQLYKSDFTSFSEFTLWRVGGYFTTAHNNGAMALTTQLPLPLPYWTLQPIWEFPGVKDGAWDYHALTGFDPYVAHMDMLTQYGTVELNNEGGLFAPLIDYGLFGYLAFWLAGGFVAGRLYRGFLAGTLSGLALYPIAFMTILNAPLILYVCFPATFPPLVTLAMVAWRANRAGRTAQFAQSLHWPQAFNTMLAGPLHQEDIHHG